MPLLRCASVVHGTVDHHAEHLHHGPPVLRALSSFLIPSFPLAPILPLFLFLALLSPLLLSVFKESMTLLMFRRRLATLEDGVWSAGLSSPPTAGYVRDACRAGMYPSALILVPARATDLPFFAVAVVVVVAVVMVVIAELVVKTSASPPGKLTMSLMSWLAFLQSPRRLLDSTVSLSLR
ncbi:hypothetical protein PsorP6_015276 [Peronosclerospora sorghi]|uniref:Uncharacterized protein n=1 Tax=Peronosclerospora sorghi TaxID=230839 RepID=A0ACC0VU77_9STRA|nr:hypothetical protein PsorP6_015276 [Peronosclerospora sorghi]